MGKRMTNAPFQEYAYTTAHTVCGWYDTSQTAIVALTGTDRMDLLHRLTTNEVQDLQAGQGRQTVLLTEKARIVDVVTVMVETDRILLHLTDTTAVAVQTWFKKYIVMDDVKVRDVSSAFASFRVFGPQSALLLDDLTGEKDHAHLPYFAMHKRMLFGVECTVIKLHQFVEQNYTILCNQADADTIAQGLRSIDTIAEIHAAEYDVLRIEAGQGKLGYEWTEEHNPLEAQLVGLVNFKKGCYIGQEVIARLDTYNKVKVRLMGFTAEQAIPVGTEFRDQEKSIGSITSSCYSPLLKKHIALGYLRTAFTNPGVEIVGYHNSTTLPLHIEKLPFMV
jgi:tRNA-modifying protein YgfZ